MATWLTPAEAAQFWRDFPADHVLGSVYLEAAKAAVLAYAPALETPDIPESYRLAQVMQARNLWNSGRANPSAGFEDGGYGLTAFPLDWQIKNLLRPQRGLGAIA